VGEAFHLFRAGLRPEQVLETLAHRPLADGEEADVVVLGASPLESLSALADVQLVVRGGRRFI
jgi:hypothetical protein